ncbi:MAG: hypothetical protein ACR2ML_02860 [Solirubrobacteraceae bacterium]
MEAVHEQRAETLAELAHLRSRTRGTLRSFWFPLVLFGGLTLASAPLYAIGGAAVGVFWLVAAPAGIVATSRYYRRRELRLGIEGPTAPYVATGIAIALAAWLTGALGGEEVSTYGPSLAIAAGTLVFAALDRSAALAGVAAGLVAAAAAVALAGVGTAAAPLLAAAFGAGYLIAGLLFRRDERQRG